MTSARPYYSSLSKFKAIDWEDFLGYPRKHRKLESLFEILLDSSFQSRAPFLLLLSTYAFCCLSDMFPDNLTYVPYHISYMN